MCTCNWANYVYLMPMQAHLLVCTYVRARVCTRLMHIYARLPVCACAIAYLLRLGMCVTHTHTIHMCVHTCLCARWGLFRVDVILTGLGGVGLFSTFQARTRDSCGFPYALDAQRPQAPNSSDILWQQGGSDLGCASYR
jgi:hypothetical protein